MALADVDVKIDQGEIQKQLQEKLDQKLHQVLIFWDINEMSKRTCLSKSFLENEFLCHPKMKVLERRKYKGKRIWPFEESVRVIREIMDTEW